MYLEAFVHAQFVKHSQMRKVTLEAKSIKMLGLTLTAIEMKSHTR